MKKCMGCAAQYSSSESTCTACGLNTNRFDGFIAYAPTAAQEGSGFRSNHFTTLANLEANNFWFRARNRLIIWSLGYYVPNLKSFLEIGCGTGYVLSGIANAYPHAHLQGSELFTKGLIFAANRLPNINFMQMDARNIPFVDEFDCIGAFDVLEHIEEDTQVLAQIHQALKPQGIVLITVPQHQWLWSPIDEIACHVRRYSTKELHAKLQENGFEVLRSTSFVTTLLPVMLLSRLFQKFSSAKETNPETELNIPRWLNFIFENILNAEIGLIRCGINFPLGGSRLMIARKI
jgi:SAM-dependent methyltransferase